jgi:hypothetical protein
MASCILLARHALVHRLRFQQSLVWPAGQFILRSGGGGCMLTGGCSCWLYLGLVVWKWGLHGSNPRLQCMQRGPGAPGSRPTKPLASGQLVVVCITLTASANPLAQSSMGRPHCLVLLHASMLSPQHSAVLAAPHRTSHTCLLLASPGDRCDEGDEVMRQCSKADAVQQR